MSPSPQRQGGKAAEGHSTPQRGIPKKDPPSPTPTRQDISRAILVEACKAVKSEIRDNSVCVIGDAALSILGLQHQTKSIDLLTGNRRRAVVREEMRKSDDFWIDTYRQTYLASDGRAYLVNVLEHADIGMSPIHGFGCRIAVNGVFVLKPALLLNMKVHSFRVPKEDVGQRERDLGDICFLLQYMRRNRLRMDSEDAELITSDARAEIIRCKPETARLWRVIGLSTSKASSPSQSSRGSQSSYDSTGSLRPKFNPRYSHGSGWSLTSGHANRTGGSATPASGRGPATTLSATSSAMAQAGIRRDSAALPASGLVGPSNISAQAGSSPRSASSLASVRASLAKWTIESPAFSQADSSQNTPPSPSPGRTAPFCELVPSAVEGQPHHGQGYAPSTASSRVGPSHLYAPSTASSHADPSLLCSPQTECSRVDNHQRPQATPKPSRASRVRSSLLGRFNRAKEESSQKPAWR